MKQVPEPSCISHTLVPGYYTEANLPRLSWLALVILVLPLLFMIIISSGHVGAASDAQPTITNFAPTGGPVGTSVTINGENLTGATSVQFNSTAATFTVNSATKITAVVPAGATTGMISVTTPGGTVTSDGNFTVVSHRSYIPLVITPPKWERVGNNIGGVYSVAWCREQDQTRSFVGAPDGVYVLNGNQWQMVKEISRVYDIVTNDTCDVVAAAAFENGVLRRTASDWVQVGNKDPVAKTSSMLFTGDLLFAGGSAGIYVFDLTENGADSQWTRVVSASESEPITRLGMTTYADGAVRLYATQAGKGVWTCTQNMAGQPPTNCNTPADWGSLIAGPSIDSYGWDVLGLADATPNLATDDVILLGTNSGRVWRKQGTSDWEELKKWENGRAYSLAQYNGNVFAGVSAQGVWFSSDKGDTWAQFGSELDSRSPYELSVSSDGYLYAATLDSGVWKIRLP